MSNIGLFLPRNALAKTDLRRDEPVQWLQEYEKDKPTRGLYRYQLVRVVRNDRMVDFTKELGPASAFPNASPSFTVLSLGEFTAEEIVDIADAHRDDRPSNDREPTDLIGEYRNELEEKQSLRARRSVFGPGITVVRSF